MKEAALWETYPRLYHMAAAGSWPAIREHGLLSTSALLDLFEIDGPARDEIEITHRPESLRIVHPRHGRATVRDQKPMSDGALRKCLQGMSPAEWYRLLNRRVYFWPTAARLEGLLMARPYRDKEHCVLTLDTRSLVAAHAGAMKLSPINSGSTLYNPQPRGSETFQSIADYPFDERRRLRGRMNAVAEVTVDYAVSDVARHVLLVERRVGTGVVETVWRR